MGQRLKKFFQSKTAKICLIALVALLLLLAAWSVFGKSQSSYRPTETEARLVKLLSEIEGIDSATAMVTEEEGRAVGAVIVFEGKDSLLTRSRILDIASALLRLEKKYVQVYPAEH